MLLSSSTSPLVVNVGSRPDVGDESASIQLTRAGSGAPVESVASFMRTRPLSFRLTPSMPVRVARLISASKPRYSLPLLSVTRASLMPAPATRKPMASSGIRRLPSISVGCVADGERSGPFMPANRAASETSIDNTSASTMVVVPSSTVTVAMFKTKVPVVATNEPLAIPREALPLACNCTD